MIAIELMIVNARTVPWLTCHRKVSFGGLLRFCLFFLRARSRPMASDLALAAAAVQRSTGASSAIMLYYIISSTVIGIGIGIRN